MNQTSYALQLQNVSWTYNRGQGTSPFTLKDVSLAVRERECFVLLGASGCGKTTLLKLAAGLLSPDAGDVRLGDVLVTPMAPEHRGIGMVFQQPLLFPHMTVAENVSFPLRMQRVGRTERHNQAVQWLERVGLAGYAARMPDTLSGGQQQRVALARAFAARPRLLLMDEPFSALDPLTREEMRTLFRAIRQVEPLPVLFVTHDRDEAFELADRIGVMKNGRMEDVGPPHRLYDAPATTYIAELLGAVIQWDGECIDGRLRLPLPIGEITLAQASLHPSFPHGDQRCSGTVIIRPECVRVHRELPQDNRIVAQGRVRNIRQRPGGLRCWVQVDGLHREIEAMTDQPLSIGDATTVSFRLADLRWIPGQHKEEGTC
jgi:ABC-type Fe3+/spermidine/putrescine transport system ATPase subunit